MLKRRLENLAYDDVRLTISPQNIRFGYYNEERAKKLAQEIWLAGAILQPISVSEENQKLEILDGQHRHKALLILKDRYGKDKMREKNLDTIPAIIYNDLDETLKLNVCQRIANNPPLKPSYGLMIESFATNFLVEYEELKMEGRSESAAFAQLNYGKTEIRDSIIGWIIQRIRNDTNSRIRSFIKESGMKKEVYLTAKNFSYFLGELCKLTALEPDERDNRDEEYENILSLTNWIYDNILSSAIRQDVEKQSLVARYRMWALGRIMADVLKRSRCENFRNPAFGKISDVQAMNGYLNKLNAVHWDLYLYNQSVDEIYNQVAQIVFQ